MSGNVTEQVIEENNANGAAKMAQIIYILYLASFVIGLTGIVGVIMAYVNKGDAPAWIQSHYQYQIRTFWIGMLLTVISIATMIIAVGYFLLLAMAVWFIIRCVVGLKHLGKKNSIPDPRTWIW